MIDSSRWSWSPPALCLTPCLSLGGIGKAGQEAESRTNSYERRLGSFLNHRGLRSCRSLYLQPGKPKTVTDRGSWSEVYFLHQSLLCPHSSYNANGCLTSLPCQPHGSSASLSFIINTCSSLSSHLLNIYFLMY